MARWTFECIDAHTCGNPVRVIKTGRPELEGETINEKRIHFMKSYDWIRTGLMFEPRGHDMMSGSFLYPPSDPKNDTAVLFIETSGCLPMCGHGTIGMVTIAIQEGLITPKKKGELRLETPAGLVEISYKEKDGKVESVKLTNVLSYLAEAGLHIECPGLGKIDFDVAYGGNFYAIIDPQTNFSGVQDYSASDLIQYAREIRSMINQKYPDLFVHPENSSIRGVSHIEWTGESLHPESSGRNAVFYGDKAIDRSACGTGTSARMAQLFTKGLWKSEDPFVHESYIGSTFVGRIEEVTKLGDKVAIRPSIEGWAKVFGYNTITIDEDDPFAHGFQVI
ncbi:MAG: 4-hydroxyproline epimerase [Flavobacteriaceae bacterium]|nr:4-hydroxyproline epimerase [Flavobacteriaceae bacterium]